MTERRHQTGSAIIIVILALLAVSALATVMIVMSQSDHLISANERDAERALFASKAGLNFAFHQYQQGVIVPTVSGTAFDSLTAAVSDPLKGGAFSGNVFKTASAPGQAQLFRIVSTGTFNRATRTTELVFQIVPEAFKYGYMAFNEAVLHNHSGLAGPTFKIESTIFSNGTVKVPENITLDGTIVASSHVEVDTGATIKGDVFANSLEFLAGSGLVEGDVTLLTSVLGLSASAGSWDRVDSMGNKYAWYNSLSFPGSVTGGGTIGGSQSSYTIQDNDPFRYSIFRRDGTLIMNPNLNVTKYVAPPMIDYAAMKTEADLNDPTYFTSMTAAMTYLGTKKVVETIDGKTVTTIRVGTTSLPEFLYVADDFTLTLDPSAGADDPGTGLMKADGFHLEGGIYASGMLSLNGPAYDSSLHPAPPSWYQFKINALPYCFPALMAYSEPSSGTIATWVPADTPVMTGNGSKLNVKSEASPHEGFVLLNGLTYAEKDQHFHHTQSSDELIRFNGAQLGWKLHDCDYFWFSYDPDVRCTRFLVADEGTPELVSFRELR